MRKQTNMLSPSPKGFQSPKFSDSDSDVRKALPFSASKIYEYLTKLLITVYIENGRSNATATTLAFTIATGGTWKIKVSQIECYSLAK
jgi:hypothetical protein